MPHSDGEARAWAALAPEVPVAWFVRESHLHGVAHTRRVHVHAQRLTSELRWSDADVRLVLSAALWHDIGRTHDGEDERHGMQSAARALRLGLLDALPEDEGDLVLFAIVHHCRAEDEAEDAAGWWHAARLRAAARRPGEAEPPGAIAGTAAGAPADDGARRLAEPERALRILWLLKDADALDRVRLAGWETADPAQLRHPQTIRLLPFATELYRLTER